MRPRNAPVVGTEQEATPRNRHLSQAKAEEKVVSPQKRPNAQNRTLLVHMYTAGITVKNKNLHGGQSDFGKISLAPRLSSLTPQMRKLCQGWEFNCTAKQTQRLAVVVVKVQCTIVRAQHVVAAVHCRHIRCNNSCGNTGQAYRCEKAVPITVNKHSYAYRRCPLNTCSTEYRSCSKPCIS